MVDHRQYFLLNDRATAARKGVVAGALYRYRHGLGFALFVALLAGYVWLTGWMGTVVAVMLLGSALGLGWRRG